MSENTADIDSILSFWFADIADGFEVKQQHKLWYGADEAVDQQIRLNFAQCLQRARSGNLQCWNETAKGSLALLLLLDQFSRNIYRGQAAAFSSDAQALATAKRGVLQCVDRELTWVQRSFFYMPFEHSEQLVDQERGVQLFEQLLQQAPEQGADYIRSCLSFARQHCEIIREFGRFPHRNRCLKRESTDSELAYLKNGGARFGQ